MKKPPNRSRSKKLTDTAPIKPSASKDVDARHFVELWVLTYFSREFYIPSSRFSKDTLLTLWGHGDERSLAYLTAQFNKSIALVPYWPGFFITPPELINGVLGKTINDLITFLSSKIENSTITTLAIEDLLASSNLFVTYLGLDQPPTCPTDTLSGWVKCWVITFLERLFSPAALTLTANLTSDLHFSNNLLVSMAPVFRRDILSDNVFHIDSAKLVLSGPDLNTEAKSGTLGQLIGLLTQKAESAQLLS